MKVKKTVYIKKTECCGCSACLAICPKNAIIMKEDNEGFDYPIIDERLCIHCKLCEKVCPIRAIVYAERTTSNG